VKLIVRSGAQAGTELELTAKRLVAGRDESCDLVLADERASRQHAAFERQPGGSYTVVDLDSANGTFVDGEQIAVPTELTAGSEIRIGSTVLAIQGPLPAATAIGAPASPGQAPGAAAPPPSPSRIARLQTGLRRWRWAAIGLGVAALAGLGTALGLVFTGGSTTIAVITQEVTGPVVTLVETVVVTGQTATEQTPTETAPDDGATTEQTSSETAPDEDGATTGQDNVLSAEGVALAAGVPDSIFFGVGCWAPPDEVLEVPGAVAAMGCGGEGGDPELLYRLFESREAMASAYAEGVSLLGLEENTGDCAAGDDSEGTWSTDGVESGRLLCATLENEQFLAWTFDDLAILTTIIAPGDSPEARQQAHDLWLVAGPERNYVTEDWLK